MKQIFAAVIVLLALCGTTASAQTSLSYASYLSSRHNVNRLAIAPYFERIEQNLDGELSFRMFTSGTIVGGRNTLAAVRDGVVDMGLAVDLFIPGHLRTSAVLGEMALLLEDPWVAAGAANEMQLLNCEQCNSDLIRNNAKPLVAYTSTPFYLLCHNSEFSLQDMVGKRVRAVGPWAVWAAAMGATPVNITGSEIYEGLERGQIDCTVGSMAWLNTYSLKEVVKSVVMLPMGVYAGGSMINMNMDRWESLSDQQRAAFIDNASQLVVDVIVSYDAADKRAYDAGVERGINYVEAPTELRQLRDAHLQTEFKRVIQLADKRGIKDGETLLATYARLVEKWRGIADETGQDPALFKVRLDQEIFSKLK